MRLRTDNPHNLPPRLYERRSTRRIVWWVKGIDNRTHIVRYVPISATEEQVAIARAAAIANHKLDEILAPIGPSRQAKTDQARIDGWMANAGIADPKATRMRGGLPSWAATLYSDSKRRAAARGIGWTLGQGEFAAIVGRSAGICEVSGHPLSLTIGGQKGPYGPSIDRVRSDLGYVAGNVRIVCVAMNFAMNSWGLDAFLPIAKALIKRAEAAESNSKLQNHITKLSNA